jgi:hypothetical protein
MKGGFKSIPTPVVAKVGLGALQELGARLNWLLSQSDKERGEIKRTADELINVLLAGCRCLEHAAVSHTEAMRSIAETRATFPTMFPAHKKSARKVEAFLLGDLALGSKYDLKITGRKSFSLETVANRILVEWIGAIQVQAYNQLIMRLQSVDALMAPRMEVEVLFMDFPLTRESAGRWMDEIWRQLLLQIPQPERDPVLKRFARSPIRRDGKPAARMKGINDEGESSTRVRASNDRADIKDKLKYYLMRMLRITTHLS